MKRQFYPSDLSDKEWEQIKEKFIKKLFDRSIEESND